MHALIIHRLNVGAKSLLNLGCEALGLFVQDINRFWPRVWNAYQGAEKGRECACSKLSHEDQPSRFYWVCRSSSLWPFGLPGPATLAGVIGCANACICP